VSLAVERIVALAREAGATVVESSAGTIIVLPAASDRDELLPIRAAAREAATTVRVVQDAVRRGELPAVGRQRDRAVRRSDLESWIQSRRMPVAAVAQDQAARVERRLGSRRRTGTNRRDGAA
jgi:hypothetical protein